MLATRKLLARFPVNSCAPNKQHRISHRPLAGMLVSNRQLDVQPPAIHNNCTNHYSSGLQRSTAGRSSSPPAPSSTPAPTIGQPGKVLPTLRRDLGMGCFPAAQRRSECGVRNRRCLSLSNFPSLASSTTRFFRRVPTIPLANARRFGILSFNFSFLVQSQSGARCTKGQAGKLPAYAI